MRLVQILVSDDDRDDVFDILDEREVDFVTLDTDRRDADLVVFPLPSGAVEEIVTQFREAGVEPEQYTTISDLDAAMTPNFDALEKEYTEGPDAESRVARGELRTSAREIEPDRTIFVVQAVLSATVAAAGLLLDSAIAVVGAMVISPFTSSLLSAALGAVVDDTGLLVDGLKPQLLGLSLAALTGAGVGFLARWLSLVPPDHAIAGMKQITNFSSPPPISSFSRSQSLPGVPVRSHWRRIRASYSPVWPSPQRSCPRPPLSESVSPGASYPSLSALSSFS